MVFCAKSKRFNDKMFRQDGKSLSLRELRVTGVLNIFKLEVSILSFQGLTAGRSWAWSGQTFTDDEGESFTESNLGTNELPTSSSSSHRYKIIRANKILCKKNSIHNSYTFQ